MALDTDLIDARDREAAEEELVRAAADLVAVLQERAPTAEALRRLPDETIDDLERIGLLRLTTPESRGGFQVSPRTFLRVMTELARGCAATSGGFLLSGRWPFCTGQHHADWAIMSALTSNHDDIPEVGFFLVPRCEFTSAADMSSRGFYPTAPLCLCFMPS